MNEPIVLPLISYMSRPEGWGREEGRTVYPSILKFVEAHPGTLVFRISLKGVERADMSFLSETIVQIARRYRGTKGFCLVDIDSEDMLENCDAAAAQSEQPLVVWHDEQYHLIGPQPGAGVRTAFEFALSRASMRVADFVDNTQGVSLTNASNKFKQLWQLGYLLRQERAADTGGVEYVYFRIR